MATVNEKIKNALNDYNVGLKVKLDTRFVKQSDFASDTFVTKVAGKTLSSNDFTDADKLKLNSVATDTYVTKVAGKTLSSNDFTDADKLKLNSVETDTYVTKVAGKGLSANDFTDNYKSRLDGLETTYAKKSEVASALKYKGTITDFNSIPSDTTVGDVWNISVGGGVDENGVAIKDGDNVAITETGADVLAGSIDLSNYTQIYIGAVQPSDTSVVWFDTSAYI